MKKMRYLVYFISLGVLLLTTVIGCEYEGAQVNQSDSPNITSGSNLDPGPDGNPATYDQNPDNLPLSALKTYENINRVEVQNPTKYGAPPRCMRYL
ncbi:MAG: hypothetical protein IPP15_16120 [Saprospiraceae bacterium]|uniref:Uncharacterized protein n=1 Tax=Candidatus Opimibacter skivensis TaxID=2982028 RepID=A0A9D7SZY3_9BACT|nr:hypothetical protein [Candidatus Opimibacter skivensis]